MIGMTITLAQTGGSAQGNAGTLNRSTLDEIAKHFDSGAMIPLEWIAIASGLVIVVISLMSLYRWYTTRHLRANPSKVFRTAAREAGLTWPQQLLLWRIARQQHLPSPLTLLLSSATLEHHASAYAAKRSAHGAAAVLDAVADIHRKLDGP